MKNTNYPFMFSSGKIGRLTIKNRTVMSPMGAHNALVGGAIDERGVAMYEERAKGGVGLIIVGMMVVEREHGLAIPGQYEVSPDTENSFHVLTDAVHAHGTKIFGQLYHGGNMCDPELTGNQNISSSNIATYPTRVPRPMTVEEIQAMKKKFVEKALLLQLANFDGVEIHAANGYLLAQFLSPYYNKREDEYGGSFENRFRFLREIIEDVRAAVGPEFAISVRFAGDEFCSDLSPLHLTLEDGLQIAKAIEATGKVDVLNISNGNGINQDANCEPFSYREGWKKNVSKAFKESCTLPIIATNTVKGPEYAETLLADGCCDFLGLGRSLLADPFFVNKTWEGKEDEIRRCIGCMHCRSSGHEGGLQCAINPRMFRESEYYRLSKNGSGRKAVVIGGGPCGLQCSLTLAERGFNVTLLEKETDVGGSLNAADKPPLKEKIALLIQIMRRQAERAGVKIVTGCDATPEMVKSAYDPDVVFLAVGGEPIIPRMAGADQDNVYTPQYVLKNELDLPGSVVVVGSGMTGMEVAETLAAKGSKITMVEMQAQYGPGMAPVLINDLMSRLGPHDPTILTRHMLTAIRADGVQCKNLSTGELLEIKADHIILALGVKPDSGYIESFREMFGTQVVFDAGDAVKSGKIYHAIKDGYLKASRFDRV